MIFIGVDPGKHGGIAALDEGAEPLLVLPMPVIAGAKKAEYDLRRIFERLVRQGNAHVWIEKLRPMPVSMGGGATNYQRGYSMGMLEAFCVALKLRYQFIAASVWQRAFWKGSGNTKQRAVLEAERLFPTVDFLPTERSRKPHDGMADALLIAEYGRRFETGLLT